MAKIVLGKVKGDTGYSPKLTLTKEGDTLKFTVENEDGSKQTETLETSTPVNPDWTATNQNSLAYILNKPYLGPAAAASISENLDSTKTNMLPTVGAILQSKGSASGLASLDENGKVPTSQLPSYVDDVEEYLKKDNFPNPGEIGKIYVDTFTNLTYRWGGSGYVEISPSIALGETSSTAYAGDKGKTLSDTVTKITPSFVNNELRFG